MSKEQEEKIDKEELNTQNTSEETTDTAAEAQADAAAEEATEEETEGDNAQKSAEESLDDKINKLTEDLEKANKEYLFLLAEFDNFRKRTVREKADIIRNAGEKVLGQLLPIIDDFERFKTSVSLPYSVTTETAPFFNSGNFTVGIFSRKRTSFNSETSSSNRGARTTVSFFCIAIFSMVINALNSSR